MKLLNSKSKVEDWVLNFRLSTCEKPQCQNSAMAQPASRGRRVAAKGNAWLYVVQLS